ncbi:PAMC1 / RESC15 [Leishmania donovani]|nr:PAMC1 / RESC15 [Leishmania donovani]
MRRTRRSVEAGLSAAARTLTQPRMAGKAGAQSDITGAARCCSTTAANAAAGGAAAPSTATRPVRQLRLAVVRPDILDDWVPELNDVVAHQISCDEATTLVWWRCSCCQQRYQCTVQTRVARGRTACPHCGGGISAAGDASASNSAAVSVTHKPQGVAAPRVEVGETLDKTHPDLAARWDVARNGALLPSHVTASSTRQVWWLPATNTASLSSAAQRSFLRPVFAFVHDSASPEEQAAATAAMEWRLLHEIRRVAHIEDAEKAGVIPVTVRSDKFGATHAAAWLAGSGDAAVAASRPSVATTAAADVRVVARMWKDRMSGLATPENAEDSSFPQSSASRLGGVFPRELFAHSPTTARRAAMSAEAAAASTVRVALLGQYFEFVRRQRRGGGSSKERTRLTPVLASLAQSISIAAAAASTAAEGTSQSWTDFFALTRDSALPKGYIDPNAALYFPDAAEVAASGAEVTAVSEATKADSLRLTAPQISDTVLTMYPRRPPSPRLREDDVMQATPPMMDARAENGSSDISAIHQVKRHQLRHHVHMPFGHTTTVAEENAAKLAAEYDVDDDDSGSGMDSRRARTTDNAASFATELRGASRRSGEAATAASLIGSAIAALGEAFSVGEADSSSRLYHREAHRTAALSDELMASSGDSARRTGTRPRRFRLSLPHEAPQTRQRNVAVELIAADGSSAVRPAHFEAPHTPRKVARPRRATKEASSAAAQ